MHPNFPTTVGLAQAFVLALASVPASAAADSTDRITARVDISALSARATISRFIVKLDAASDAAVVDAELARVGRASGLRFDRVRQLATGGWLVEARDPAKAGATATLDGAEAARFMRELARHPAIAAIEPDRLLTHAFTPNDEFYREQSAYFYARFGTNTSGAWHYSTGAGVNVAVIDSGITPHSDLVANVLGGYDFISDMDAARDGDGRDANPNDEGDWHAMGECADDPGSATDSSWHGSYIAGAIAARTNNGKGIAGMAHGAKVVPVRVLGRCGGTLSDITEAIVWASGGSVAGAPANVNPAKVINLSISGQGGCSAAMQDAIDVAVGNGAVVVVAAGNAGADVANYTPANCNDVVAVAATAESAIFPGYSNYGDRIDVAAPGTMKSTVNSGLTMQTSEAYSMQTGTSVSAALVASLAAMILAEGPFTPRQVENLMKYNGTAALDCIFDEIRSCGWGAIDALHTLRAIGVGYNGDTVSTPLPSLFARPTHFENTANHYISSSGPVEPSPNTVWGQYAKKAPVATIVKFKLALRGTGTINPRDFQVFLKSPTGAFKKLHDYGPVFAFTQTVDASDSIADGLWRLYALHDGDGNNVYIDSWSITFPSGGGPL
jgi:serine protease